MLKFYVRDGMIFGKLHGIISLKQSRWLEKNISFNTQKRNRAKNDFEKDLFKLLVNAAFGKFSENVRNRSKLKINKKDDNKNVIEQQPKLTFNGIHISYEKYDRYTFKRNEVVMDKAIFIGFAILELSKLHVYETYYDKLQPHFGLENLQLHYIDEDGLILSMKTENMIKDSKSLKIYSFSVIWMNILNYLVMKTKKLLVNSK